MIWLRSFLPTALVFITSIQALLLEPRALSNAACNAIEAVISPASAVFYPGIYEQGRLKRAYTTDAPYHFTQLGSPSYSNDTYYCEQLE